MDRRKWLARAGGMVAADVLWPRELGALAQRLAPAAGSAAALPAADGDAEPDWHALRSEFLIPSGRIYLNVGTLGVQPRVVVDAVVEHTRRVAMSLPPGVAWDALKEACGTLLGCDAAGFVFPRNTTEAMNFVANGLELAAGDEVVTTDHEHIGGLCCWELIAARRGVTLTKVTLPAAYDDAGALRDAIVAALGVRTRVLSVSHVLFTNGTVLPVAELAAECRRRGIIFVVDGAHPPGLMPVNIAAIDPDFYATSPHKWLLAPQGSGLLWMREEWRTRLWPTLASGGWDDAALGAHRFNQLGSMDESRLAGLAAALAFHDAVGEPHVYARIAALRAQIVQRVQELPGARLQSPSHATRGAGLVAFSVAGRDASDVQRRLAEANVRIRVVSEDGRGWIRLSPHIHSMPDEIETVFELLRR
jgi:isopenicillin-N epimerase